MGSLDSLVGQAGRAIGRALAFGEEAALLLARVLTIAAVLLLGWGAYRVTTGLIRRLLRPLAEGPDGNARAQRARTLGPLLASVARYVVAFVVAIVVLQELGIDVRALILSAGVLGLALSLGAQSLIRDVITGSFILFENLIAVGDVIEVGAHVGVVEAVGLRVTKIRKFSGELRIVPNGELTAFSHHSATWARAVVEVTVAAEQDVGRALGVLEAAGRAWRDDHPGTVLEPPVAEGILRFEQADPVLRLHARVSAAQRFPLELELRQRVKAALEAEAVPRAAPQMTVRLSPDGRAPVDPLMRKESRP